MVKTVRFPLVIVEIGYGMKEGLQEKALFLNVNFTE